MGGSQVAFDVCATLLLTQYMIIGKLNEQCQRPPVHSATYEGMGGSQVAFDVCATLLLTHVLLPLISNLLIVSITDGERPERERGVLLDRESSEKICDTADREAGWGASTSPAVKPLEWVRTRCRVLWR
ncbi:hypothetical protein HanOQP8_Chr17g0678581 [Helianthus annuus]|nr:hypothetical protein HanHA89_Chr17g0725671 [Helianthus annuus]KAJ0637848.1 hypothetical protein HanOQP8_Chr17g0678581 [Helianthus annuus]